MIFLSVYVVPSIRLICVYAFCICIVYITLVSVCILVMFEFHLCENGMCVSCLFIVNFCTLFLTWNGYV